MLIPAGDVLAENVWRWRLDDPAQVALILLLIMSSKLALLRTTDNWHQLPVGTGGVGNFEYY